MNLVKPSYFKHGKTLEISQPPLTHPTLLETLEVLKCSAWLRLWIKVKKKPNPKIFSQSVSLTQYVVLSVRLPACLPVCSS